MTTGILKSRGTTAAALSKEHPEASESTLATAEVSSSEFLNGSNHSEEDDHEDASHPQHAPVRERTCLDVDLASRVLLEDEHEERGQEDADGEDKEDTQVS